MKKVFLILFCICTLSATPLFAKTDSHQAKPTTKTTKHTSAKVAKAKAVKTKVVKTKLVKNKVTKTEIAKTVSEKPVGQTLDQIVAIVNDDIVTKSELNKALAIFRMQNTQDKTPLPAETTLQKQVLNQLISKKLQLQMAKQVGIKVSDEDLEKAIGNIAKMNGMSVSDLMQRLNREGMATNDYRNEMREQIMMHKLQQQEVVNRVTVSPQEVSHFMQSKAWQDNSSKEYKLEDILVPLPENPSPDVIAAAKKRAEVTLAKLKSGTDLQTLTSADTTNGQNLQTGDLGWRKLPEIPSAFADLVSHMQTKEIGGPIQTSNGFHILRLAEVRNLDTQKTTLKREQVQQLLLQRKFEEAVQNWVSKLRSQAFVVINLA